MSGGHFHAEFAIRRGSHDSSNEFGFIFVSIKVICHFVGMHGGNYFCQIGETSEKDRNASVSLLNFHKIFLKKMTFNFNTLL